MSRKIKHNLVIIGFIFSVRNKGVFNLKVRILSFGILLVIMALLPVVAVKCSFADSNYKASSATNDSVSNIKADEIDKNKILCGLLAGEYKENYCKEALKAVAILINTDYAVKPESFDVNDKDICIFEEDTDNSLRENYSKIEDVFDSVSELKISVNDEFKYIPYSDTSNGNTVKSESYEYLTCVASPWDCYSEGYSEETQCVGVSLNGIDYLCKNGASAEEALKWYLPNCKIEKTAEN